MESLGDYYDLNQWVWCPYKMTQTQREDYVKTQGEGSHLQIKVRGLEQILA